MSEAEDKKNIIVDKIMRELFEEGEKTDVEKNVAMKSAIRNAISYFEDSEFFIFDCDDFGGNVWGINCKSCKTKAECKLVKKLKNSIR